MKKIKSGFTLAEVMITLGIIGIVAAITLPSVMSNYQYKTVGVKLSKFMATTEDSSRAYVVGNDSFKNNKDATNFINEAFLIKSLEGKQDNGVFKDVNGQNVSMADYPLYYTVQSNEIKNLPDKYKQSGLIATLKDGTNIVVSMVPSNLSYTGTHKGVVDTHKVGLPAFNINFAPEVNGLPSTVQSNFNFIVTELGFVLPHANDDCLWQIYDDNFVTNAKTFNIGSACNPKSKNSDNK